MAKKHVYLFLVLIGIAVIYFWARAIMFVDPDFGIHMRMGQIILERGIPKTDTFSYTMPSYPAVDHEWLVDILFVLLMPVIGYSGLAGIFTFIAIGALLLQWVAVTKKNRRFMLIPLFLAIVLLALFFGIRPQVISWFFFSLMLVIVRDLKLLRRWGFGLPVVFLIWANLHGGFPAGLVVLLLALIYWVIKSKFPILNSFVIFLFSLGMTFVTIYGWRTWWEIWMVASDGSLRWRISEWRPTIFFSYFSFWILIVLTAFLIIRYIKKFTFLDIFLYFGLLLGGFSAARNVPLWVFMGLPVATEGLVFLNKEASAIKYGSRRFIIALKGFFVIVFLFCLMDLLGNTPIMWRFQAHYPDRAINFLHQHTPRGQIFSIYDWGGYLVWKLPEKKLFINGRMPHWRRAIPVKGESSHVFDDYIGFLDGDLSFRSITEKYGISTLILPAEKKQAKNSIIEAIDNFDSSVKKVLHFPEGKDTGFSKIAASAKKKGWKVVYKDEEIIVYQDRRYEESH